MFLRKYIKIKFCRKYTKAGKAGKAGKAAFVFTFALKLLSTSVGRPVPEALAKQVPGTTTGGRGGKADISEPHRCTSQSCQGGETVKSRRAGPPAICWRPAGMGGKTKPEPVVNQGTKGPWPDARECQM